MNTPNTKFDFDAVAERYDRFNHLFSFGMDNRWRRQVVRTLNPQLQQRLLDVCTGTGDLVFSFLRYSAVRHVTGLDISEAMLSLAQEKQIIHSAKNWMWNKTIDWRLADATDTTLESGSFDYITCVFGIRNIPDRAAVLKEMYRLLKPGGKLCIVEFSLPSHRLLRAVYWFYLNHVMPAAGRFVLGSKEPLLYLANSIRCWHTDVKFSLELSQSGFKLIHKTPLTGGVATLWLARKS